MNLRLVTLNFWGIEPPLDRRLELATRQLRALAPDVSRMQEVPAARRRERADDRRTRSPRASACTRTTRCPCSGTDGEYARACRRGRRASRSCRARAAARGTSGSRCPSRGRPRRGSCCRARSRPRRGRSGCTRRTCTTGSTTASRASGRSSRSTPRSARGATDTSPPQILCGDFNATPDSDEIRFLRGLHTLDGRRTHFQDAWLRRHGDARGHHVVERERADAAAALARSRSPHRLRVRDEPQEGRARHGARLPRRARPSATATAGSARATTTACWRMSRSAPPRGRIPCERFVQQGIVMSR